MPRLRPVRLSATPRLLAALAALVPTLVATGCDEPVQVTPQSATATGRVVGTDGTGAPHAPVSITVAHTPGTSAPRVASTSAGLQNVQGIDLTITRTGIPIAESFYLMSLSRPTLHPDSNDPDDAVAGGADADFVRDNVGDLAEAYVDTHELDATLTHSFNDFPAPLPNGETNPIRPAGATYLGRIEIDDIAIPFSDPSAVIDVQRLATLFFDTFSAAITGGAGASYVLGGPDGDGDFRMHFVPHVTHSTVTLPDRNVKGFGFIFAASLGILDPVVGAVPIGSADVYLPVTVLLEPDGTVAPFRVFVDPFSMLNSDTNPPDNLERIMVVAEGLVPGAIASGVLDAVTTSIASTSQATLDTLDDGLDLMASVLDAALPSSVDDLPDDWDLLLVPESALGGVVRNRILPAAGGVPVKLYILQ